MTKIYKDSKKISVTVGIPTFNEEENITHLLQSLLNQKDTHAIIEKIHIIDDMSKDNTVKNVSTFQDKRIQVLVRNKRLGQTSAQNIIFEEATTDVVLILEADTCPVEINYVDIMIQPLLKNSRIGYIQGSMIPLPSRTLLGKILNRHFSIFTKLVIENKSFHLPITSGRGGRIFAKAVYTRLRWPSDVPDDDYAAVWCIANNFSTYFCRKAHCHYQRPQSFNDYIK
ncbi:MAG TPA: glycosyltransferase family 2 protein, partial [Candidatus Saccharimonadales bacterium]|nr:glycosyltransferase family 2 protein [Candidatus Saccharimonadales bacterium]